MNASPVRAIRHPSAWTAAERATDPGFSETLSDRQLEALDDALNHARAAGATPETVDASVLNLSRIADDVVRWRKAVVDGCGIVLLRGFPVERYPMADLALLYAGLGRHFGHLVSQSVMGDTVGHVIDMSDVQENARSYQNRSEMMLHTDFCDIIAMLCVRPAAAGGVSRYASFATIHNIIAERHPEHLPVLRRGFPIHRMGEERQGDPPVTPHRVPVFAETAGYFAGRYCHPLVTKASLATGRALDPAEEAALACFDRVASSPEVRLDLALAAGDLTITNNLRILHSRSAIANDPDPARKRHLLRLWIDCPEAMARPGSFDIYGNGGGIDRDDARLPGYAGETLRRQTGYR